MKYQIIDNYLDKNYYEILSRQIVKNNNFPWYMSNGVSVAEKSESPGCPDLSNDVLKSFGENVYDGCYFTHLLHNGLHYTSNKFEIILPLIEKLNPFVIRRIKVNLYPTTQKIQKHGWHIDYDIPHKGAIYYLNTNDGKTILDDGMEIDSVANRMLFFDPSIKHRSTTCTDDSHGRYNINFNFI